MVPWFVGLYNVPGTKYKVPGTFYLVLGTIFSYYPIQ